MKSLLQVLDYFTRKVNEEGRLECLDVARRYLEHGIINYQLYSMIINFVNNYTTGDRKAADKATAAIHKANDLSIRQRLYDE